MILMGGVSMLLFIGMPKILENSKYTENHHAPPPPYHSVSVSPISLY